MNRSVSSDYRSWIQRIAPLLLTSLLGPAVQGRDERAFARWESAIAAFEKQDREQPPPKHAVVFVGSSSIRLWDLAKSFPGMDVINRGFGGSEIADTTHFLDRLVIKHEPRLVIFYAGDNDIANGKSPERVAADFEAMERALHARLPETRLVYFSIKPSPSRWKRWAQAQQANQQIEAYCKSHDRVQFVDAGSALLGRDGLPRPELFQKDGLHLSAQGYEVWAKLVAPLLKPSVAGRAARN